MADNKQAYPNCWDLRFCSNCEHSRITCGEILCRWHEAYVSPTGKRPWWEVKNV